MRVQISSRSANKLPAASSSAIRNRAVGGWKSWRPPGGEVGSLLDGAREFGELWGTAPASVPPSLKHDEIKAIVLLSRSTPPVPIGTLGSDDSDGRLAFLDTLQPAAPTQNRAYEFGPSL